MLSFIDTMKLNNAAQPLYPGAHLRPEGIDIYELKPLPSHIST